MSTYPKPLSLPSHLSSACVNLKKPRLEPFLALNPPASALRPAANTAFGVLFAISLCHLLNDLQQSLIPAIYPLLKQNFHLNYAQVGLITLTFQMTASLLQPVVGAYTDRKPQPFSLAIGMTATLIGLLWLATAPSYAAVLASAAMVGLGSSVFHPESSRLARVASGGRHGLAQSLFQVGGNAGTAAGPLLAAYIVVPHGQKSLAWFALAALLAITILTRLGFWYRSQQRRGATARHGSDLALPARQVTAAILILLALILSKYLYLVSMSTYFTFYLIEKFHVPVRDAQLHLFFFLGAVAAGTIIGGPIGDRYGRKYVIWGSILGVLPFTLALPYADLMWTGILSVIIGLVLASAFSAIIVYAQELVPGRVGLISGMFFGFAFGVAGLGAAALGVLADWKGIGTVYHLCSFLPLFGLLAGFLPSMQHTTSQSSNT